MSGAQFDTTFPSGIHMVKPVIMEAMAFITRQINELPPQIESDLRLVLSELLYNAVIHGNRNDIRKRVRLAIGIDGGEITAMITDAGRGFDHVSLTRRLTREDDLLEEHGRGIRLVRSLVDGVAFNPAGNQVEFRKKVKADG